MTEPGIRWRFIATAVVRLLLPLWFVIYGTLLVLNLVGHGFQFIDIEVYRAAAAAALAGRDPWALQPGALAFAGPPPTLLLFMPLTFVPLEVAIVVATTAFVVAAIWAVRRLGLPLWWVLFPPVMRHSPVAAAIVGLGTPLAPPIAIILIALQERLGLEPPPAEPPP